MTQRAKRSRVSKPARARGAAVPAPLVGQLPEPPETQYIKLDRRLEQLTKEEVKLNDEFQKQRRRLDKMDLLDPKYFMQQGVVVYQAKLLMQARETLRLVLGTGLAGEVRPEE